MKTTYTLFDGTTITAHNAREARLARIIIAEMEDVIKYLNKNELVGKSLCRDTWNHHLITDISGELTACYFLDMITAPMHNIEVWDMISDEFWKRYGWTA